jgi:hypothetical protein
MKKEAAHKMKRGSFQKTSDEKGGIVQRTSDEKRATPQNAKGLISKYL